MRTLGIVLSFPIAECLLERGEVQITVVALPAFATNDALSRSTRPLSLVVSGGRTYRGISF